MNTVIPSCSDKVAQSTTDHSSQVCFHLSLNVANLESSVAFFQTFFGREPAKCRPDYAKFELTDPPLVLSLEPFHAPPGGNLNHLGFRLTNSAALVDVQRRLEANGISTQREEGVECCYARQTKFWVHDPDGNMWEVYTLDEDIEHRGDGQIPVAISQATANSPTPVIWAHRLRESFSQRLPIMDESVDQVLLQGTLNEKLTDEEVSRRLSEVRRILKTTGKVYVHMLTADRPTGDTEIKLPGPAALVEVVPEEKVVVAHFEAAGFSTVNVVFRGQSACFKVGECELRETKIEITK